MYDDFKEKLLQSKFKRYLTLTSNIKILSKRNCIKISQILSLSLSLSKFKGAMPFCFLTMVSLETP